jgi:hypothetical protein
MAEKIQKLESKGSPRRSGAASIIGIAVTVLGAIFVALGIAPFLVPGGLPTGFLEYGGKHANAVESILGALIMIIGYAIWRFGHRHKVIVAAGIVLVFFLSVISAFSSINSSFVIGSINITIQYGSNDQGYFGPSLQTIPVSNRLNQNLTVDEGSSFKLSFSLNESSLAHGDDGIATIKATNPEYVFTVTSVKPALPIAFSPGISTQINVSLTAPYYSLGQTTPFNGTINLVLTTTGG